MSRKASQHYFSSTYREARERFLIGCERLDAGVESLRHPLEGPDGLPLYLDAARIGPKDAEGLLVLVSGTHGPEGHCGSACQLHWLENAGSRPESVSVLLVHAHNPYGFAWGIRHTQERVDLNRNFISHDAPPENSLAAEFFDELGDAREMTGPEYIARFTTLRDGYIARYGAAETRTWLGHGQYSHEQGLHFGGIDATWSRVMLTDLLRRHGTAAQEVLLIDIHTGLGRYGYGELLSLHEGNSQTFARSRAIWGGTVYSMPDGRSAATYSVGNVSGAVAGILPNAIVTAHALEFGTFEGPELFELKLRYQHALARGEIETDSAAQLRDAYRGLFFPEQADWMELVLTRAEMVTRQALTWLNGADAHRNSGTPTNDVSFDRRTTHGI